MMGVSRLPLEERVILSEANVLRVAPLVPTLLMLLDWQLNRHFSQ